MAYSTRRPGGGWSRVSSYSDYANVVSNYAVALAQAQQAQSQTELESKVFNYKQGLITYQELVTYLKGRLSTELPGSQRELDLRQTLASLDEYESEKNRDIERSKLEARYSKDGISASERVLIEQQLLQYYKQGTPAYTEQLNVIAKSKELETQERKNEKIAQLEGKLSEGGLTTGEQIQIMEEARGMADKGSKEYGEFTTKINQLKEAEKQEKLEKKKNAEISSMMDKMAPGGLSNQELLELNKVEQKYAKPGSEEYIKLKEAEANILEAMQEEGRVGAGKAEAESKKKAAIELKKLQADADATEAEFAAGNITQKEYNERMGSILEKMQTTADTIGEEASVEGQDSLYERTSRYMKYKKEAESGNVITVVSKDGTKKVVSTGNYRAISDASGEDSQGYEDADGNSRVGKVVTVDVNGQIKKIFIDDDTGEAEEVTAVKDDEGVTVTTRTGKKVPLKEVAKTAPANPKITMGPKTATPTAAPAPIPGATKANPLGTYTDPLGTKKSSGGSSSSSKSSKGGFTTLDVTPKKTSSTAVNYTPNKTTTSSSTNKSNAVTNLLKTAVKGTKPSATPLPDYGITEKLGIGKAVKKVTKKVTDLFKKKK